MVIIGWVVVVATCILLLVAGGIVLWCLTGTTKEKDDKWRLIVFFAKYQLPWIGVYSFLAIAVIFTIIWLAQQPWAWPKI